MHDDFSIFRALISEAEVNIKRFFAITTVCLVLVGCGEPSPSPSPEGQSILPHPIRTPNETEKIFRGPTQYGDEFQVTYPSDRWEMIQDPRVRVVLKHKTISDCVVWLQYPPMGVGPASNTYELTLGNYQWTRRDIPAEQQTLYTLIIDRKTYLFGARYTETTPVELLEQCLADAEAVIATFEPH